MIKIKQIYSFVRRLLQRGAVVEHELPSLIRGLHRIAPRKVIREVMVASVDRRQWGLLTAAWMGISEKELMAAVARELRLPFAANVPSVSLIQFGLDSEKILDELRLAAAVPVSNGTSIVAFVAVDPAEVRTIRLFDGSQEIRVGCASDIIKVLGDAEKELINARQRAEEEESRRSVQLCEKLLQIVMREVKAHGAEVFDIVTVDGRTTYQFLTRAQHRATGNIHSSVAKSFLRFLLSLCNRADLNMLGEPYEIDSLGSVDSFRVKLRKISIESNSIEQVGAIQVEKKPETILPSIEQVKNSMHIVGSAESNSEESSQAIKGSDTSVTKNSPIVLVVDDNPMFCKVVERLLRRDGYSVVLAENGAEALSKLGYSKEAGQAGSESIVPDLIVSDLHMPNMNGKEFLHKLKEDVRYAAIPTVMLTSDDDPSAELELLDYGADAFVSKVKDPRVLCAHVRRLTLKGDVKKAA